MHSAALELASFEGHSVAYLNAHPNLCSLSSSRSVNASRRARSVSAMRERVEASQYQLSSALVMATIAL